MIDIIVDKIVEGLSSDLGAGSTIYSDNLVEHVTNKGLVKESTNKTIAVLEDDAVPTEFDIADRMAQTTEVYTVRIQLLIRSAEEEAGKAMRRVITRRIKHSLLRKNGEVFTGVLTAEDTDTGYSEQPKKYTIVRTSYDGAKVDGVLLYISEIELAVDTDVNYFEE